jgi:hypothetical protein
LHSGSVLPSSIIIIPLEKKIPTEFLHAFCTEIEKIQSFSAQKRKNASLTMMQQFSAYNPSIDAV